MNAHSPAPWRKKVFADGSFNVVSFGNGFVCQYTSEKADAEERALAEVDGSLIVAAPDLLAALKDLLDHTCGTDSFCEWCERHAPKDRDGSINGPIPHVSDCLRLAAERAIAKAEGR